VLSAGANLGSDPTRKGVRCHARSIAARCAECLSAQADSAVVPVDPAHRLPHRHSHHHTLNPHHTVTSLVAHIKSRGPEGIRDAGPLCPIPVRDSTVDRELPAGSAAHRCGIILHTMNGGIYWGARTRESSDPSCSRTFTSRNCRASWGQDRGFGGRCWSGVRKARPALLFHGEPLGGGCNRVLRSPQRHLLRDASSS
jgi:hypothetical protein